MVDVLVIGGGLAGWRAAQAAVRAGCSVRLVANGRGNSPEIHALNCPLHPDDSVERYIEDTMRAGKGANDRALVETLCRESVALKDEFPFDRNPDGSYLLLQTLGASVPRCASIGHAIGEYALREIQTELRGKVEVVEGRVTEIVRECRREGAPETEDGPARGTPETEDGPARGGPETEDGPAPRFPGHDCFSFSFVKVTKGERVNHWELPNCVYHICFRLADSVPQNVLMTWQAERSQLEAFRDAGGLPMSEEERARALWMLSNKVGKFLDSGYGECLLDKPGVARLLSDVVFHDDGTKYFVHAIGIMPNHVHVLVQAVEGYPLKEIVEQWKRISSHRINRAIGRQGTVWREDHYNRIVRDRDEFANQMNYVCGNDMVGSWSAGAGRAGNVGGSAGAGRDGNGGWPGAGRAGNVCGAPRAAVYAVRLASGDQFSARSVVLATGGWCGKYPFSTNPPYLRGDGIALAQALGAAVRDRNVVQYEPTVALAPPRLRGIPVITTMLFEGATFRNAEGREFLSDKHVNKDEMTSAILAEIEAGRGIDGGVWYDATGVSAETMANRYGATYARYAAADVDISTTPMLVAPAPHTSLGGVVIDVRGRVLRPDGSPIPGLFAAGEVTGGLHGLNRLGGNAGTETLVFGKIAGESAAEFATGAGRAGNVCGAPSPRGK